MAGYHTTTTINGGEKQVFTGSRGGGGGGGVGGGEPGGGGYFLLLTLSELCLLLSPDKLLHSSPGDRQADSCKGGGNKMHTFN